ncbi:hypothetical protein F4X90_06380 [Candidatus Poribacteria bacterium]|nr:hypothetical protein [Candidatus Poribacteria bacterium]
MFEKFAQLDSSTCDSVVNHLHSLSGHLYPDVSNYAKGRQRFWLQTEFPLSLKYQQFQSGVQDKRLWGWLQQVWDKSQLNGSPEAALAIYGDVPIEFHPDAPCAAPNAVQINLGGTTFIHDSVPSGPSNRHGRGYKPTSPIEHTLDRGEITRFNCKHVHATVAPQPDRWSIIVWQISQYGRQAYQQYLAQR